jgi:hypothetical protein
VVTGQEGCGAGDLLEKSPYEADGGELIGRDPRKMTVGEFNRAGIEGETWGGTGLQVIRAKCMDCCVEQEVELRKCVAITCANWPYRMGENPFRVKKQLSDEARTALRERARTMLPKRHAAGSSNGTVPSEKLPDAPEGQG